MDNANAKQILKNANKDNITTKKKKIACQFALKTANIEMVAATVIKVTIWYRIANAKSASLAPIMMLVL